MLWRWHEGTKAGLYHLISIFAQRGIANFRRQGETFFFWRYRQPEAIRRKLEQTPAAE
jgi:hypothetical protein